MKSGRYPCGWCGREVGENSVWCAGCERWCHQRCSGVRDVRKAGVGFRCQACVGGGQREVDVTQVRMSEATIEVVDSFCYLGDVVRCELSRSRSCSEGEDSLCLEKQEGTDKLISEPEYPAWQQSTGVQSVCEISAPVWGTGLGYDETA